MYLIGSFLFLLAVLMSPARARPSLIDNGYRYIQVSVGYDVPDEDANTVVEMIKELLTVASGDMYYAMNGRAYIEEVTILVPNHWTQEMVPSLNGVNNRNTFYEEGDIHIGRMNRQRGEAPYTQERSSDCGATEYGEARQPIQISLEYLKGLHSNKEEMTVNYGPMGKLFVQEFTKYHYGIHEEYGYPGKQDDEENVEQFPSLYLQSFRDKDDVMKMAVVPNYCADINLTGDYRNYKVEGDHIAEESCEINDATGEIMSPSCYFHSTDGVDQQAYSSISSFQHSTVKSDEFMIFCDDTEYFPHNHEAPSLHNDNCEGASQWETILSHYEFGDGRNPPVFIEDTTPTFFVKSWSTAKFVLVLDCSNSMAQHAKMEHLKTTSIRWITQLKPGTYIAIVKFGTSGSIVHSWVEADKAEAELIDSINKIQADGGGSCMACGLKKAEEIEDVRISGRDAIHCNFLCMDVGMSLDDQTNKDVVIYIRIAEQGSHPSIMEYIQSTNVKDADGDIVDGYTFSVEEQTNQVILEHPHPEAGTYVVGIKFKKKISIKFMVQVKVIGHKSSPSSEPYMVECQYPNELINENGFLITGYVKQGQTIVKGENLYARISQSLDEDPSGLDSSSCIVQLHDDGLKQWSGDIHSFDGIFTHILDPRNCWDHSVTNVERMQVMCTMVSTPDTVVNDNTFFSKRKVESFQQKSQSDSVTPYCCGTSNQTWTRNQEVKFVRRNTYNTSIKVELNDIPEKDWLTVDFGPPGRITDLRASRLRNETSGIVKLKWTGAGDDPAYGTPASYNVHYSTKRSNLYTKNLKKSSQVSSNMLRSGSLDPVPIGQEMSLTVAIPSLEIPGSYHFSVQAVDSHGNEAKASNIVSVNFHDKSPVVRDASPLHVHGIQTSDAPLIDKLRKRYKDERIVQGFLKKVQKTKEMVWEAENSVMEKRLRKRMGNNQKVMANIINTIKNNPDQRNAYKKILL